MPVYMWSADLDVEKTKMIERRLREALPDLVMISSIDDVFSAPAGKPGDCIYVLTTVSSRDRQTFTKLIDIASHNHDQFFIIIISDEISVDDYKTVISSGGADWVSTKTAPQDALKIISRRQASAETTPRASLRKSVAISFVPSAGGVGNTTLVVEVGIHLKTNKATRHRSICLVDLNLQSSNVCDYLDIEPRLQIQEISANPERLDEQLFDIFISRHSSGLDVFAAPRTKFEYCNLDVLALDTLFSIASTRYDLMLIDLPVTWFSWTSDIIGASDALLVTAVNSVPALRQTVETLAAVRDTPRAPDQIAVAINRCQRRLLGGVLRRNHVQTVLGREQVFYVGEEPMALESINTGVPMAWTKNYRAIGKDVSILSGYCAAVKAATGVERRR